MHMKSKQTALVHIPYTGVSSPVANNVRHSCCSLC